MAPCVFQPWLHALERLEGWQPESGGMGLTQMGLGQHWAGVQDRGVRVGVGPLSLRVTTVPPAGAAEEGQAWSQDTQTVGRDGERPFSFAGSSLVS